jgi:peptidyl-prolyl cis-trans isomerase C
MSRPMMIAALALVIFSCAPCPPPTDEFPPNVVATVGDVRITQDQVNRMMDGLDKPGLSPSELRGEAIEELIAQELLYQEAERRGIEIGEAEVAAQMDLLRREFLSQQAFEEAKKNGDLSDQAIRRQLRRDLAIARLLNAEIYDRLTVDPEEMVARPREVRELYIYRRIYPGAPESKHQEAWEKMRQAREKLLAGEDFGEVVKEYSQSGLAKYGGDAGFIAYNPTNELNKALFALKEGQISDIIETKWGLYILKAEEIRPERMQAFGELEPKLQRIVLQRRMQEKLDEFVEELKRQTDVEKIS